MPTNHKGRLIAIAVVLLTALIAIFPDLFVEGWKRPSMLLHPMSYLNLKPGIDMVGGTALLYEIKPPEGGYTSELSTHVMDALKKRVDPQGIMNLVWRPQGDTRLEIQLPRSGNSGEGEKIRAEFGQAQKALEATNAREGSVLDAIERFKGEDRQRRLDALAMDSASRKRIFASLTDAYDRLEAARATKTSAAQAAADIDFEAAKKQISTTDIDLSELDSMLTVIETAKAAQVGNPGAKAPPKDVEAMITDLKVRATDFPSQLAALNNYITAHADYFRVRDQLDDAASLKRLLRGSGVLEFHILVDRADPRVAEMVARLESGQGTAVRSGDTSRWAAIDRPEQFSSPTGIVRPYAGRMWLLIDTRPEKSMTQLTGEKWSLKSAQPLRDQQTGDTEVGFNFDPQGGVYMGRLTGSNVQKPMAIVLDDKVISAPNINSQINDSGRITGHYTGAEIKYLVNTLNAGSLPATLADEPISERTIGPQLGADNLRSGFMACGIGLVVVAIFLIGYYFLAGVVAFFAVLLNLVLILGALAAYNATFTLPGVAALVLTLGTAVDANVLIFERLREEQLRGLPIRTAMRNAYDRAFSAIFDSNVVTAIVSLVLYLLGSEEVKGFGLTLLIGIVASLFTSLFVTKTIFAILIDKFGIKRLNSIPMVFPGWDKALKPHFDWMSKVWILGIVSVTVMCIGLGFFVHFISAGQMFDIEFSSGTSVTIALKEPMKIEDVRKLLETSGDRSATVTGAAPGASSVKTAAAAAGDRKILVKDAIPSPSVVSVGSDDKSYEIVTPNVDVPAVRSAVFETFQDKLQIQLPSTFKGVGQAMTPMLDAQVFVVAAKPPVGRFVPDQWGAYRGGVAIYLDNISPPLSPVEIERRITDQRLQPGATKTALPPVAVFAPGGADVKTSEAVVLAVDPKILADQDQEKWAVDIADPLWKLINDALASPPNLAKVSNFNASVAGATQQDALTALGLAMAVIMAYMWVRFGNLKYGLANTAALLHDTFFILGALGVAHLLGGTKMGQMLLLEPFRINLTVVAGVLTIMAYSMVDTIVVFDRIREIRGQRGTLTKQVINDAINQTLSRTLLTAGTTLATLFVMYMFGGAGIHAFTFVLLIGILVGTYSSVAIAAPLLLIGASKASKPESTGKSGTQLQRA